MKPYSLIRVSQRKKKILQAKNERLKKLELFGYCSTCKIIKKIVDISEQYLKHQLRIYTGKCVKCGTEIYKKEGCRWRDKSMIQISPKAVKV